MFDIVARRFAHQNRTIPIASDVRVDGAKSPENPQKGQVLGSEIAAGNCKPPGKNNYCNVKFPVTW